MSEEKESIEDLLKELNVIPDEDASNSSAEKDSEKSGSPKPIEKKEDTPSPEEKKESEKKAKEKEDPRKGERNIVFQDEEKAGIGTGEKVSMLIGGVALLVALGIALLLFLFPLIKEPNWIKNEYSHHKYPVSGKNLIIGDVKSHWAYKEKETDGVPELEYTPVSEIFINKKSGTGVMRAFYLNGRGKYAGDVLTASFKDGKFGEKKSVIFRGSEGFERESDFHAYDSGYGPPWYLLVLEGKDEKTPASEFKLVLKTPLYFHRKPAEEETPN